MNYINAKYVLKLFVLYAILGTIVPLLFGKELVVALVFGVIFGGLTVTIGEYLAAKTTRIRD